MLRVDVICRVCCVVLCCGCEMVIYFVITIYTFTCYSSNEVYRDDVGAASKSVNSEEFLASSIFMCLYTFICYISSIYI